MRRMSTRWLRATTAVAATMALVMMSPTPGIAAQEAPGIAAQEAPGIAAQEAPGIAAAAQTWYQLRNKKTDEDGQALLLTGGSGLKDQPSVWWLKGVGAGEQAWTFDGPSTAYHIRSGKTDSQLALSILNNSSTNGTAVVTWTYQPNNVYEQWHLVSLGNNFWHIESNGHPGKCLAVTGGTASTIPIGSKAIIWDCGSGPDQAWRLTNWT
jgi:hypothetical protein